MTGESRFSCYLAGKIMQGSSNCCPFLGQHSGMSYLLEGATCI